MPYFVLDNQPFFASEQQYLPDGTPLPTVPAPDNPGQIWDGEVWVDPPPPKVVDMAAFKRKCLLIFNRHITQLQEYVATATDPQIKGGYNLLNTVFASVVPPTQNEDETFDFTSADGAMAIWNSVMPGAIVAGGVILTTKDIETYNQNYSDYLLGRYEMLPNGHVEMNLGVV